MSELTIIIPAYNEADSLRNFIPEVIEFCRRSDIKLIVINDGSSDDTGAILERFAAASDLSVITHKVYRGYGGAIKSGIRLADTKYVVTIDADGQHDLNDVAMMYESILRYDADMIVGNRSAHGSASIYRNLGKTLIRWFAKLLLPIQITDINSGIKIYNAELAKQYIRLCPDHMAFSDIITLVFINQRRLVLEQPVNIRPRSDGTSTITTLTAVETVQEILNIVVLFNPMRVFFPLSLFSLIGALAWGIPILLSNRGVSIGAMLGFTSGLIFFLLGLLAEQLSQIRKDFLDD